MNFMKSFRNKKKYKNVALEETAAVDVPNTKKTSTPTLEEKDKHSTAT